MCCVCIVTEPVNSPDHVCFSLTCWHSVMLNLYVSCPETAGQRDLKEWGIEPMTFYLDNDLLY